MVLFPSVICRFSTAFMIKVAILGSRGIPNRYGGFEEFAEHLSLGLVARGMEVWVYCSHYHPYRGGIYHGVHRISCIDPERRLGTAGQFLYDLRCICDSHRRDFDVILQLGYTSSSIWHRFLPRGAGIITNMDGLEWKRSKYNAPVRRFLRYAERLAMRSSHALVADSEAIQQYLSDTYDCPSVFIPYGAVPCGAPGPESPREMGLEPGSYFLVIARMQPDNHIEEVIRGVLNSRSPFPLVVVGNTANSYGNRLMAQYNTSRIRFAGSLFDRQLLNGLRHHCSLYFHGHSAGGTNPSLLEAMASSAPVCAHDNPFNRSVLDTDALWFSHADDIANHIDNMPGSQWRQEIIHNNLEKIRTKYNWDNVIDNYETLIRQTGQRKK